MRALLKMYLLTGDVEVITKDENGNPMPRPMYKFTSDDKGSIIYSSGVDGFEFKWE